MEDIVMQHRIETEVEPSGTIILRDLPFHEGEKVVVVITTHSTEPGREKHYPLRGLSVEYKNPFDSVAEDEWVRCSDCVVEEQRQ
ncbi:MAG: hypothetical protein AABN34_24680 [Acidobacteriota bacterium]